MIKIHDDGRTITVGDPVNLFYDTFNRDTGVQFTSNDASGNDPFMRDYPSLIDVGIMGSCQHGKSGLCAQAGIECYQSGNTIAEPNMSLRDFQWIIEQIAGSTFQVALGGRGDPNKHDDFYSIMRHAYEYGVVPNYTTSGLGLTAAEINITSRYAGAVAVSWYRSIYTLNALKNLTDAGCTTNIHYVLSTSTIDEAIRRLENDGFPYANAVIFLLHKPVGFGSKSNVLSINDGRLQKFFTLCENEHPFKIGFDSCSIPGVINYMHKVNPQSIDTCEGARFSMYISPSLKATPCSFDQSFAYGIQLCDETTIYDAWHSDNFNRFRSKLSVSCPSCSKRSLCYGGSPLTPEIVLCKRKES